MLIFLMIMVGCKTNDMAENEIDEDNYAKEVVITKLLGTWSNVEYMKNLKITGSPYKSICDVPWINIRTEGNETMFDEYLNFHEGGTGGTITDITYSEDKSRYYINVKDYFDGSSLNFKRSIIIEKADSEKDSIIYTDQENKEKYRFNKIGKSPELYANEVILAGNYKDAKGEEYIFTTSGEAIWPNETFNYQIQLDFLGGPTFIRADGSYYNDDYFMITDESGLNLRDFVYYYQIKDEQLYLFKAEEKEGEFLYEIKDVPDLVLTKE